MGRNKFEEQLKEQLQEREITPSEGAWDRISEQLEASNARRSKNFQWYGIAAGFVGIALISVIYFGTTGLPSGTETPITDVERDTTLGNSTPKIIEEQNIPEENSNEGITNEGSIDEESIDEEKSNNEKTYEENVIEETLLVDTEAHEETSIQKNNKRQTKNIKTEALASTKSEASKVEKVAVPLSASKELIDAKVAEVVARVAVLENQNNAVTDAEIDSLLRGAQQQILEDKIFRKDRSVDAMALLADVENELDQSFRDQIFEALKDGFLKVRTAVADRNR